MRASIRSFHSPDVPDLESWIPDEENCFGFLLQVIIGPEGEPGGESFEFVVCTPEWLKREHGGETAVVALRNYLLVFEFNLPRIIAKVRSLTHQLYGEDWDELAKKIARYAKWEYEDADWLKPNA